MMGYSALACIEIVWNHPTAVDQALQQAEALSRQAPVVDHILWMAGIRARYWVAVGNLEVFDEEECPSFIVVFYLLSSTGER